MSCRTKLKLFCKRFSAIFLIMWPSYRSASSSEFVNAKLKCVCDRFSVRGYSRKWPYSEPAYKNLSFLPKIFSQATPTDDLVPHSWTTNYLFFAKMIVFRARGLDKSVWTDRVCSASALIRRTEPEQWTLLFMLSDLSIRRALAIASIYIHWSGAAVVFHLITEAEAVELLCDPDQYCKKFHSLF